MLRRNIDNWLAGGHSFREGVRLLEQAGNRRSSQFNSMLSKPYIRPADKERLRAELVATLRRLPDEEAEQVERQAMFIPEGPEDTPRITALRRKGRMLMKERSDLKSKLIIQALDDPDKYTDEDRFLICQQIMQESVPALDKVYGQIRRFDEEGIEPAGDEDRIRQEAIAQMKELQSVRPQISRLRSAKKRGETIDEAKLAALEARKTELEELTGE